VSGKKRPGKVGQKRNWNGIKLNLADIVNEELFVRFYVTDEAHIYSLFNLLSSNDSDEFKYLLPQNRQLDHVNYLAQYHFVYYEMQMRNYYELLQNTPADRINYTQLFKRSEMVSRE